MPIMMLLDEDLPGSGGGRGWVGKGELTAQKMGTFLQGRVVSKFVFKTDSYQNTTAIILFGDGNSLEIYAGPNDNCRLDYHIGLKKKNR